MQCLNTNVSNIYNYACPSHGWEAIQNFIYTTVNSLDQKYQIATVDLPDWVEVTGHGSQRRLKLASLIGQPEGYDPDPIAATTQKTVVADALTKTGSLWIHSVSNVSQSGHGSVLQRQDAVHGINTGYYQPYTAASCANDVISGPRDSRPVAFPLPPAVDSDLMLNKTEYNDSMLAMYSFVYPGITRDQILNSHGAQNQTRLQWVELPQHPFNGSAIGAVILLPRSTANLTQEILVCNLGAGWGSTLVNTSSFDGGTTFTTSVVDTTSFSTSSQYNLSSPFRNTLTKAENLNVANVDYYSLPLYPEKRIIVTEAWASYLNPYVPALNTTIIDALMSTWKPAGELNPYARTTTANLALSGLLANGLASIGATGTLQGDIKTVVKSDGSTQWDGDYWFSGKGDMFIVDPEESKDWVKFRVDSTINGYAYNIRGTPPKVAITFLLVYCVIALSHVVYAGISGKCLLHILRSSSDPR